jgi:hypothetical protein
LGEGIELVEVCPFLDAANKSFTFPSTFSLSLGLPLLLLLVFVIGNSLLIGKRKSLLILILIRRELLRPLQRGFGGA